MLNIFLGMAENWQWMNKPTNCRSNKHAIFKSWGFFMIFHVWTDLRVIVNNKSMQSYLSTLDKSIKCIDRSKSWETPHPVTSCVPDLETHLQRCLRKQLGGSIATKLYQSISSRILDHSCSSSLVFLLRLH